MLGGEITEPPDGRTDDPIIPRVSSRLLRQDKLEMLPRSSQLCAAAERERMLRSSHRDEFDSCKVNTPESFFVHVNAASDRDVCGTTAERALNFTKRFELQTKWHSRELDAETLEHLDEAGARKHRVDDDRQLA
jgi:hypothetical protein